MAVISELDKKLRVMNSDIVKLQFESIFMIENNSSQRLLANLDAWKRSKEDLVKEFYENLVPLFSDCYDALDALQRFLTSDMDARYDEVSEEIANPFDGFENDDPRGPQEVVKSISEFEVEKRVLANAVIKSKALLGEIKQDLERSGKTTVVEFLQEREYLRYFPYEWSGMYELRLRTIETAILVSKLMVQFICYLATSDRLLESLKSKIESIKNIPTTKCVMAERFVTLIEIAGDTMSWMKLKEYMFYSTIDEEELYDKMITNFYNAVMDLEWIMSFVNVPVKRAMVNGARIRLEGVLGFVLYVMQGIRLKIRKQHCDYWVRMKSIIPELWRDLEVLPSKLHEELERVEEAGTSGANQDDESEEEEEEEEGGLRSRRRSRLPKIEEEAGPSGTTNDEEDGDISGTKDDDEDAGDPPSYKKDDDEEVADSSGKQVEEAGDPYSYKKDDEEVVDTSGKQVEEAGDPSSYKKDDEEVVDTSGKQVEEAGDSSGKQLDEDAADSWGKKDEAEGGQSSGKECEKAGPWEEQYDGVASPPQRFIFGDPW